MQSVLWTSIHRGDLRYGVVTDAVRVVVVYCHTFLFGVQAILGTQHTIAIEVEAKHNFVLKDIRVYKRYLRKNVVESKTKK